MLWYYIQYYMLLMHCCCWCLLLVAGQGIIAYHSGISFDRYYDPTLHVRAVETLLWCLSFHKVIDQTILMYTLQYVRILLKIRYEFKCYLYASVPQL
jgi:hypothetical protein